MKSKKKIIILCSIVLVAILVIFGVWSWSIGCLDHLLLNEQQLHEELLTILIKASEKEHFLSQLEYFGIRYFIEKENNKESILFKNGFLEFENGEISNWAYRNAQIRIPAIPENIIYELKNSKAASAEVDKRFGTPSAMVLDKEGNFTFTYFFLRDENAKRTDGQYNAGLIIWFDDYKINNYGYIVIDDLNKKTIDELI